jgi:hypothetical protein
VGLTSQPRLKAALRGSPQINVCGSPGVPYEVRALDQIVTLVPFTLGLTAAAVLAASAKPADQAFRLSVLFDEENRLEFRWSVAPGYFLYRDKVSATLNGKPWKVKTASRRDNG